MKKSIFMMLAIAVVLSLGACSSNTKKVEKGDRHEETLHEDHDGHEGHDHGTVDADGDETAMLCGNCGQIKGSEDCCKEGVEKCEKCGLDTGSPGCCKITEDTKLCSHCGQIAGSDDCCIEGAVKCEKCGLDAASPGCCKI